MDLSYFSGYVAPTITPSAWYVNAFFANVMYCGVFSFVARSMIVCPYPSSAALWLMYVRRITPRCCLCATSNMGFSPSSQPMNGLAINASNPAS